MTETQEIATISDADYEVAMAAILDGAPLPEGKGVVDPAAVSRDIADRIFKAETFEDVFSAQTLPAWTDYLNVPVLVKSLHLNPTAIKVAEGTPTVYAVVDIANVVDGETRTVTCGGRNVLAQLVKMLKHNWFDHPVKLVSKKTGEGFDALWLVDASSKGDE